MASTESPEVTLLNAVHRLAADSIEIEGSLIEAIERIKAVQEFSPTHMGAALITQNEGVLKLITAQRKLLALITETTLTAFDKIDEWGKKLEAAKNEDLSQD